MPLKKMSAFDTTGVRFGAGYLGFDGLAGWIDCILQDFLFNYFVLAVSFSIFDFRFSIFDFSSLRSQTLYRVCNGCFGSLETDRN